MIETVPALNNLLLGYVVIRGGVKDTTFEATAKDSKKI